ncbi:hypothetical protein SLA2020_213420 [Shorea laevis]
MDKPKGRMKSPLVEEPTNLGLAQSNTKEYTKATKNEESRNIRTARGSAEEEEVDLFWKGFEEEEGRLKEWMGKNTVGKPKRKKRKIRSCKVVYLKSRAIGEETQRRKGEGRQSKQKQMEKTASDSIACSDRQVAGASMGDTKIQSCNRKWKGQIR